MRCASGIRIVGGKLWQWDVGREVTVSGAPEGYSVAFACVGDAEAMVLEGAATVRVPDELLQTGRRLSCWVQDADGNVTDASTWPVMQRPKPSDYVYTPTDYESLQQVKAWVEGYVEGAVKPATRSTLGTVMIGDGIDVDSAGKITAQGASFMSNEDFLKLF